MSRYPHSGRTDQNRASIRREADARALFDKCHWRGAMYLLGYAIECRLKARLLEMHDINTLDDLERVLSRRWKKEVDLRTHNLESLFEFTGARRRLVSPDGNEANLKAFQVCTRWTPSWRYHPEEGRQDECRYFFEVAERFLRFVSQSV